MRLSEWLRTTARDECCSRRTLLRGTAVGVASSIVLLLVACDGGGEGEGNGLGGEGDDEDDEDD